MAEMLADVIALAAAAITLDRGAFVAALDPSRPLAVGLVEQTGPAAVGIDDRPATDESSPDDPC